MANINEILNAIPKKNKIIIAGFLGLCGVAGVVLPTVMKDMNTGEYDSGEQQVTSTGVVTNNGTKIHVGEAGTGTVVNSEAKVKENSLFSYKINDKEYSFKVGKDGYSHILLGGLKTSTGHENNILTLISVNPTKEKVVYTIFDPRARYVDGTINPQEIANGTALMNGVAKDLGIEIQYYGTLGSNSIGDLTRNFIDPTTKVYENGINVGHSFIKDNQTGFDLLTKDKGTIRNNEIVSKFLDEVTFDHVRNKFEVIIFDLFGKAGAGNNLTNEELESFGNLLKKDGMVKKLNKSTNMFVYGEAGFYDLGYLTKEDGTEQRYGKLSQKAIDEFKKSLD